MWKMIFRILICGLTAFQPLGLYAQNQPPVPPDTPISKESDERFQYALTEAEAFNRDVESLRQALFGEDHRGFHEDHPLDTFSLLKQQVHPPNGKKSDDHEVKPPQAFDPENINTYSTKSVFSEVRQDVYQFFHGVIPIEDLSVEIFKDTSSEPSHPTQKKVVRALRALGETGSSNTVFASDFSLLQKEGGEEAQPLKYSFQINYRGKAIHSFPNHVHWMVFMGSYLVFLEPSRIKEDKATISFIDLKFLQMDLGKSALPVFHFPVIFNNHVQRETLQDPDYLHFKEDTLYVGSLEISLQQMDFLSQLNQIVYNIVVSFLDQTSINESTTLTKDIVDTYIGALEKKHSQVVQQFQPHLHESYNSVKEAILNSVVTRQDMGSINDFSGRFYQKKDHEDYLNERIKDLNPQDLKTLETFSSHLNQEPQWQAALRQTSSHAMLEKKFSVRFGLWLSHISRYRAMGGLKIQKALAGVAAEKNLKLPFKDKIKLLRQKMSRHKKISAAVLVGAVGLSSTASLEAAKYFWQTLKMLPMHFYHLWDLGTSSLVLGFEGFYSSSFFDNYIKEGKWEQLSVGLLSLLLAGSAAVFIPHFIINTQKYIQSMREKQFGGKPHQNASFKERVLNKFKEESFKTLWINEKNFVNYVNMEKSRFLEDLSQDAKRAVGMSAVLTLPNGSRHSFVFKTKAHWQDVLDKFQNLSSLTWEIVQKEGGVTTHFWDLLSMKEYEKPSERKLYRDHTVTFEIYPFHNKSAKRVFRVVHGNAQALMGLGEELVSGISSVFSDKPDRTFNIDGALVSTKASLDQISRLKKALSEVDQKGQWEEDLNDRQVQTFWKAFRQFLTSAFSFRNFFRRFGLVWNGWYITRVMAYNPQAAFSVLWYGNLFDRIYSKEHRATSFNGGYTTRIKKTAQWLSSKISPPEKRQTLKEKLEALRYFENQVIPVEKKYIKLSTQAAFLETIKFSLSHTTDQKDINTSIRKAFHIQPRNLNKNSRLFFETCQRLLFEAALRDYLAEQVEGGGANRSAFSDKKIKSLLLKQIRKKGLADFSFPEETEKQIQKRMLRLMAEKNIVQKAEDVVASWAGTSKAIKNKIKREFKRENLLIPDMSRPANPLTRFKKSNEMLKTSNEALARLTRYMKYKLLIDKPVELLYSLIFMAGVDQGVLKPLSEEMFSNSHWFHLSRYVFWYGFMIHFMLDILAEPWYKVQMDSFLETDRQVPSKEYLEKHKYRHWFWSYWRHHPENSIWKNYKDYMTVVIANFVPAAMLISSMHLLSMGRIDIDFYLAGYIFVALAVPVSAMQFKSDHAFEYSIYFGLKDLILKGIDFKDKDKNLLFQPELQDYLLKASNKYRRKYNVWYALLYDNLIGWQGNLSELFMGVDRPFGPRTFQKMIYGGNAISEYIVNATDFLHEKTTNLISPVTRFCKNLFNTDRGDLEF